MSRGDDPPKARRKDKTIDPSALSQLLLDDGVRYVHLLSIAIGLGVAFLADATMLRRLNSPIETSLLGTLHTAHKTITVALVAMWVSGVALVYLRTGFVWDNFSPKLVAKIIVVSLLTLNSGLIGIYAMPRLARNVGQYPLTLPLSVLMPLSLVSGISTTSWLLALALGSSVVLKTGDASLFMLLIPASYLASVIFSSTVLFIKRANAGDVQAQTAFK